jgi:CubicO group peptidase (beta-lactamase class C family)
MNCRWLPGLLLALIGVCVNGTLGAEEPVWPGQHWETQPPESVGLRIDKLNALRDQVGGRGCVVRHGYLVYSWGDVSRADDVASAMKPVISTLLLFAVQEKRLQSVDDLVVDVEPRLRQINAGKDATMTWRHLASQTSGYGLAEKPGEAYSYNDYALAFYYDTLMGKVFHDKGTAVLKERLAQPLQFEDSYTFEVFGPKDRPGRLGLSVRDFARFGLFYLRGGQWQGKQLLKRELVDLAIHSPIPAQMPLTSGKEADMLPGQRSIGGGKSITSEGPGYYSFNWWTNGKDKLGQRFYEDLPGDTLIAAGHGGRRQLTLIPTWDLIVVWNDSETLENNRPRQNQVMKLIRQAIGK